MKELSLPINSIYRATEGEGVFIGHPQVFVRTQGCSVGCLNCDSKDTWEFKEELAQSLEQILDRVSTQSLRGKIKRISITGGDPLHPSQIVALVALIKELKARRFFVNIEAAGTRIIHEVFDQLDYISFDVKTPSTGVETSYSLVKDLIEQYPGKFQVKSVIENRKDFDYVLELKEKLASDNVNVDFNWVLTPAYNLQEEFPQERFCQVIDWNEQEGLQFRVIGQQHKWIHGPDKKHI